MKDAASHIQAMGQDPHIRQLAMDFLKDTLPYRYTYHFKWLGLPIIQMPQDIVAMQELVWDIRPDLIVETGVAHGGSLVFYASMLELLGNNGLVVGIDIDIREHNRRAIESHPLSRRIQLIQGSSIGEDVAAQVRALAQNRQRVLVALDSNHTHEHVLRELELYSPLVKSGSYVVVFDTTIEDLPDGLYPDRPWNKANNPKTAVWEFLKRNDRFVIDKQMHERLQITVAMDGYLKCVKD